ncbi:LysR family transcriptional regulator [Algisphaera agarilytica]|uniref:DNA-binding transcriptional LysR family regulator n=1 Tax=Algisphaera agarilytica TaxID=1385975 RepID=A0A7X0H871_9BACT|nr:LysR family transcriptional regulator [Algisphaera agarilytica]MBB6429609.1 DNA-binding transcriptional LysR family regulator [Algisphaera agarilytica]
MQNLRLFSDVARCHSISLAAEMHGITQSAASQRINQLEKRLGVTLLDRTVRPLELTEAGKVFLAGVGDVLQRYDRLERAVMARADSPSGVVRVSAIYSSGIDLLRQVSEEFEQQRPQINVQIAYEKPDAVYQSVIEGRADLGLLSYPDRFKKVGVIALRDEEMAVVCPPNHALAGRESVEAQELSGQEMVSFDTDLPVGRGVAQYLKQHGATPITAHSFDNLDTLKSAVAATDRFAILPKRTVRHEVEVGSLSVVSLTPTLVRPMGLITPRPHKQHAALPLATAVFVDFLLQHAGQDEPRVSLSSSESSSPASTLAGAAASAPLVGAKR